MHSLLLILDFVFDFAFVRRSQYGYLPVWLNSIASYENLEEIKTITLVFATATLR